MTTAVVHLIWAPLGREPLRRFLRSYEDHEAGAEHELVALLNGAGDAAEHAGETPPERLSAAQARSELASIPHRLIELERPCLDLAAYGAAAQLLEHEHVCFVNSHTEVLADGWLGLLLAPLRRPDVGLAGATGSWESRAELVPGPPAHWAYQLYHLRRKRREFERFPNPHVRTTGFALRRADMLELGLEAAREKESAYALESGRESITRQLERRRGSAVLVGRDGIAYEPRQWPASGTFRCGEQANLLLGDNRTREWERASAEERVRLSRYAWGG